MDGWDWVGSLGGVRLKAPKKQGEQKQTSPVNVSSFATSICAHTTNIDSAITSSLQTHFVVNPSVRKGLFAICYLSISIIKISEFWEEKKPVWLWLINANQCKTASLVSQHVTFNNIPYWATLSFVADKKLLVYICLFKRFHKGTRESENSGKLWHCQYLGVASNASCKGKHLFACICALPFV